MDETMKAARQGQVAGQTERLHKVAEGIYEALGTLQDRIRPVSNLNPPEVMTRKDEEIDEEKAPLAHELSTIVTKLEAARERISDMITRVEL